MGFMEKLAQLKFGDIDGAVELALEARRKDVFEENSELPELTEILITMSGDTLEFCKKFYEALDKEKAKA